MLELEPLDAQTQNHRFCIAILHELAHALTKHLFSPALRIGSIISDERATGRLAELSNVTISRSNYRQLGRFLTLVKPIGCGKSRTWWLLDHCQLH